MISTIELEQIVNTVGAKYPIIGLRLSKSETTQGPADTIELKLQIQLEELDQVIVEVSNQVHSILPIRAFPQVRVGREDDRISVEIKFQILVDVSFSWTARILNMNPTHTRLSVFTSNRPREDGLVSKTRPFAGTLVLDTETLLPALRLWSPDNLEVPQGNRDAREWDQFLPLTVVWV